MITRHEIGGSPVEHLSSDRFEDFLLASKQWSTPVIIENALHEWRAPQLWNTSYFRDRFGTREVSVALSESGVFRADPTTGFDHFFHRMPLAAFLDLMERNEPGRRPYLQQMPLTGDFADLRNDIVVPPQVPHGMRDRVKAQLWVSVPGNVTSLHFDLAHGLLAQVAGRKRVILFAPDQTDCLYPFPRRSKASHTSMVDVDAPDLLAFPRFAEAEGVEVVLEPMQMLFIPTFWWHHVTSLSTTTISVNFWWVPEFRIPAEAPRHAEATTEETRRISS